MKPHPCYATEIWSPGQKSLKLEVEQVQKHATQMDFKFDDRPNVICGEAACLALR